MCDNLLLYGTRIVVSEKMKLEILQKIHQGHQGIQRCRLRVNTSVWWPGVCRDMVQSCPECQQSAILSRKPLLQSSLPSLPWEKVPSDLFEHKKCTHLLVVNYFSRFFEIEKLTSTTSSKHYHSSKSHILATWYSCYSHYQQWTSMFLRRDEAVFINLWISTHHWSPSLSLVKWTS